MDPANCVVVHAGREEIRMCNLWGGASPGNLFDLQIAAGLCGYPYPLSHGNLVHQVLGIRLPKGETLTEWRSRPLTGAQIQYAFDDVRYLLPLWKSISSKLEQLDRITWAQEEFQRLKEISTAGVNDASAATAKWRKLRGAGSLDRRRLALVRDLFLWREKTAAETNRPARSVVLDDLLVEIARRNPKSPRDLQVIRGLSKRYINAILDVAHNARQLAPEAYPELLEREQDPPQVAMVTHIVSAFLSDWCVKLKLANNLVAANQEIKALVKAFFNETPIPAKSLLAQGWRKSYILPELVRLLEGKRAVRIADIQSASPLDWVDS